MRASIMWILLGGLAVLALGLYLRQYYRPHTKTIEVGLQGEAKINRFLAMQRFLESDETTVQSKRKLTPLQSVLDQDTLIVPLESLPDTPKVRTELTQWLRSGGLLVSGVSSRTPLQKEWPVHWLRLFGLKKINPNSEIDFEMELLDDLSGDNLQNLPIHEDEESTKELVLDGERFEVDDFQMYEIVPQSDHNMEVYKTSSGNVWLTTKFVGEGAVVFLANMEIFENDQIGLHQHAELLDYINRNMLGYQLTLIYHTQPLSLLKAIWDHIPYTVIVFLILIMTIILHTYYKLGPYLQSENSIQRRSLKEHLEASAQFYRRHKIKEKKSPTPPVKTEKS